MWKVSLLPRSNRTGQLPQPRRRQQPLQKPRRYPDVIIIIITSLSIANLKSYFSWPPVLELLASREMNMCVEGKPEGGVCEIVQGLYGDAAFQGTFNRA